MRRRWSIGVVVAIAIAIAVGLAGQSRALPVLRTDVPVELTLALEPDGVSLRISRDALDVTFEF